MYCPVCGDEYIERVTHCPEHDVALVEDPPDLNESISWVDRFNDRTAVRVAFMIFLVATVLYAISGFASATLFMLSQFRNWTAHEASALLNSIQTAFFPIALAALGTLAGALLLRTYLRATQASELSTGDDGRSHDSIRVGPIGSGIMRLLFAQTVVFALLWAGTGIATSREQIKQRTALQFLANEEDRPDETFITLATLNYAAYVGGVACLAIMGAGLIVTGHRRLEPNEKEAPLGP
jgi:hypothetical protein